MDKNELLNPADGDMVAALHFDLGNYDTWAIYNPGDQYLWSVTYFKDNEPGARLFIEQKEAEGFTVSHTEKRDPLHKIVILVVSDEAAGETLRNGVRAYSQARMQFLSPHRTRWQIEASGDYTRGTYEGCRTLESAAELREDLAKTQARDGSGVFEGEQVAIVRQGNGYNVARIVTSDPVTESDMRQAGERAGHESLALLAFWQFDPFAETARGLYGVRFDHYPPTAPDYPGGFLYDMFKADNEAQARAAAQAKLDFCKVEDVRIGGVWQSIDDPAHMVNTAPR